MAPHALAIAATAVVGIGAGLAVSAYGVAWFAESVLHQKLGGELPVWAMVVMGLVTTVTAAVPGFVVRDWLLRGRVRRVLRARSNCVHCRYSLLGMPVNGESMVVCPECGTPTEVDPSLGELQLGEGGERRFVPSAGVGRGWLSEKAARRLRSGTKAAGVVILVGVPAMWGGYELWLGNQAKVAQKERPQAEDMLGVVEKRQPAGVTPDDRNAWDVFSRVQLRIMDVDGASAPVKDSNGKEVFVDFTAIFDPRPPRDSDPESAMAKSDAEWNVLAREVALARLRDYRAAGVLELLDEMAARGRAVRPLHLHSEQAAVTVLLPDLGQARNVGRMNAARMHLAVNEGAGGEEEFLRAFESSLAMARMDLCQPFLIDQLVGLSIKASALERLKALLVTHPSAAVLERVRAAMDRQLIPLDPALLLEGERMACLNNAGWVFTQKKQVRFGRLSRSVPFAEGSLAGRLGTWRENQEAIDAYFARETERMMTPPYKRDAAPAVQTGLRLLDVLLPAMEKSARAFDLAAMEEVGVRVMVALELHYAKNGEYPDSLAEVVPSLLGVAPVDPWDGKALRYRRLKAGEGAGEGGWGYVLYSVGGDGVDNGGRSPGKKDRHGQFTRPPSVPQGEKGALYDYVINE